MVRPVCPGLWRDEGEQNRARTWCGSGGVRLQHPLYACTPVTSQRPIKEVALPADSSLWPLRLMDLHQDQKD